MSTSEGKDIMLLERGVRWIMALMGLSLVIAGFIVINLRNAEIGQAVWSLLYWAVGFELLFIASIFDKLSNWFARQFKRMEIGLRKQR